MGLLWSIGYLSSILSCYSSSSVNDRMAAESSNTSFDRTPGILTGRVQCDFMGVNPHTDIYSIHCAYIDPLLFCNCHVSSACLPALPCQLFVNCCSPALHRSNQEIAQVPERRRQGGWANHERETGRKQHSSNGSSSSSRMQYPLPAKPVAASSNSRGNPWLLQLQAAPGDGAGLPGLSSLRELRGDLQRVQDAAQSRQLTVREAIAAISASASSSRAARAAASRHGDVATTATAAAPNGRIEASG